MKAFKTRQDWFVLYINPGYKPVDSEVAGMSPMEMANYLLDMALQVKTTVTAVTKEDPCWSVKVEPSIGKITIRQNDNFHA